MADEPSPVIASAKNTLFLIKVMLVVEGNNAALRTMLSLQAMQKIT